MKKSKFGLLTVIVFLVQIGILVGLSVSGIMDNYLLHLFVNSVSNSNTASGQFISIFPNNVKVATIEFIPVLGILVFLFSNINDGLIISSIGVQKHISGGILFALVGLEPHTWIELYSYAIATSFSTYVVYLALRHRKLLKKMVPTAVFIYCFVVLELAIAAIFESVEITWQTNTVSSLGLYEAIIWIPGVIAMIALGLLFKKILRHMNKIWLTTEE